MRAKLIGITGGIGAGKSVISRMLSLQGYPVYDCDSRARYIMDTSPAIQQRLCAAAGSEIIEAGCINRPSLAAKLFTDPSLRLAVNEIVHEAVRQDLQAVSKAAPGKLLFVESAIMRTSSLDLLCSAIWLVTAPEQLRISRVIQRNNLTAVQIKSRISAQQGEFNSLRCPQIDVIVNDNITPLIPQIENLLNTQI